MKIIIFVILLFVLSCGYPDIDSVPSFKDVKITKEELFDLCQLSSNDKTELDSCLKEKKNR